MRRIYLVIYEYERNDPLLAQYGVAIMKHVYKCYFDQVSDIIAHVGNTTQTPLNWHMYTRDQFTDYFFGAIAEEWK